MTDDDIHDHDVRDESISTTTRRGLLGALGVAGLASLGSGSASAQLGGGPEADAMSEYRVPTYRVPESDLDSPGVVGRRVAITSGETNYSAGDELVDTGSSWELVSPGYDSVSTGNLETKSRPATILIWKSSGGTVYWDGNGQNVGSGSAASLDQAYRDALDALPSGDRPDKEAHGRIHIDGAPPEPYQWDTTQPIRGGLDLTMDGTEHRPNPEDTVGPSDVIDHTGVGYISLSTNGPMLRPPDVDNDLVSGIRLKGLTVKGQGYGNSTAFLDDTAGQNTLDLIDFIDCYVYYMTTCIYANVMDSATVRGGHYFRTGNVAIKIDQTECWISPKSVFAAAQETPGQGAINTGGTVLNTQILSSNGPGIDGLNEAKVLNCELGSNEFPDMAVKNCRRITNCDFTGTAEKQITSFPGVDNALYANNNFDRANSNTADIEINGGADIGIGHVQGSAPSLSILSQTRLRWNGVIGGGPIGGVDLSSVNGQFDGDLAVADGTSAAAAGAWARWDSGASNWQYVDPSGTV